MRLIQRLREHPNPWRFALSRTLRLTRLCGFSKIERNGYRLYFHPTALSATLWEDPTARIEDERVLEMILKPGGVFVDVGANIGTLSLKAGSIVGPRGRVVAIEAHPKTYKYLIKNVQLNSFRNIECIESAVGASETTMGISDRYSDDQNQVVEAASDLKVNLKPLDALLNHLGLPQIDLLKIDVEGFEEQVLLGAKATLQSAKAMYIEINPQALAKYKTSFSVIRSLLPEFQFFKVGPEGHLKAVVRDYHPQKCEDMLALRPNSSLNPEIN